jgi:hypothetical protein
MTRALTIEGNLKFERRSMGAKRGVKAEPSAPPKPVPLGRIPRISKLMALAIRWEGLIASGAVKDHAEIAALCHVSRARISQIMDLSLLAPDIQESLLFLPRVEGGRDPLTLRQLQKVTLTTLWQKQRAVWKSILH